MSWIVTIGESSSIAYCCCNSFRLSEWSFPNNSLDCHSFQYVTIFRALHTVGDHGVVQILRHLFSASSIPLVIVSSIQFRVVDLSFGGTL